MQGTDLVAGRRALESFQWEEARALFAAALEREETAEAHEGLGVANCWLGDKEASIAAFELAFRLYRERSDHRAAARMAIRLAIENIDALGATAIGNGWLGRARQVLEGEEPAEEHVWLDIWEAHALFLTHRDLPAARRHLDAALALARSLGVTEAAVFGTGLEGLMQVAEGQVNEGLRKLDQTTAAAVSGELRQVETIGEAYCYVMRACEQVQDYARAAEWGRRGLEVSRRLRVRFWESYCRLHHIAVQMWRGDWDDAERELESFIGEIESIAPASLPGAIARQGELRRRQGRFEEAADLFTRAEGHAASALGRAALALDRGDAEAAIDLCDRYFRALGAGERIDRAPGWSVRVRALTELGRCDEAASALASLREVAEEAGTEELAAVQRAAEGLVAAASGDRDGARRSFEDAIYLFEHTGSPFEAGRSRLDLARTLLEQGLEARAADEARVALAQLERLGARGEVARAEKLVQQIDSTIAERSGKLPRRTVDGLTPRQVEVLGWLARGLSNREIGERLFVSEFTVKRHVADILTTLDLPSRAAAAAYFARRSPE